MSNYKKEDFKKVSWEEYSQTLESLYEKLSKYTKDHKTRIDALMPILRGGAIPGIYLAYKLHILAILPIQYKYSFENGKAILRKLTDYPKNNFNLPRNPTILLVEGNHCFGNTAQTAVNDLKKEFPGCKIIYAVDHEDASFQKLKGIEANFYGKLTDETRTLSDEEAKRLGIEKDKSYLLPWEDMDEEWTTIQCKQFEYHDQGKKIKGDIKLELKLGKD